MVSKAISMKIRFILILFLTLFLLVLIIYASIYIDNPPNDLVLRYRFYRVLEAVLAGFVLGFAGSYLQASLRNPLVDHYILGIGSGALFSVYLAYLLFAGTQLVYSLIAIIGGLTALAITVLIAESIGGSATSYVLAGIGVNSLFSGLSVLLSYFILTVNPYALYLLVGSFIIATPAYLPMTIISLILVSIGYFPLAKPLNALILGDEYALQLGYNPRIYRLTSILIAGTASSIIVSCFGLIGFLGLVAPHIARLVMRSSDNRYVLPLSGLIASTLLLVTDDVSRTILVSVTGEVPAGAIVSVFGAPFFLFLILSRRRGFIK